MKYIKEKDIWNKFHELYKLLYFVLKKKKVKKYTWIVQVSAVILQLIKYHPLHR